MALRFQAALESVLKGDELVSLRVQHNEEDCEKVMAKFMDTFDSAAHPVDWECVHAHFAPPDSYVKHDGQDGEFDSYIVSRLPNVTSILLRQGINDMTCVVGLTTNKLDDITFPNGTFLMLCPGQAFKKGSVGHVGDDYLGDNELKSRMSFDDEFRISIEEHHLRVFKNEERIDDLGFTSWASLYVKVFLKESTAMIRVKETTTAPQTKGFDFNGNLIGDGGATRLSTSLAQDTSLVTFLDLSLNRVAEAGTEALAVALESGLCKLTTLLLNHNDVTDDAVERLATALQSRTCLLTRLGLVGNEIGDEGAKSLSTVLASHSCRLTVIELAFNKIGDEGVESLAWALEQEGCRLTSLNLKGNRHGPDAKKRLAQVFAAVPRLETF